MKAVMLHEYGGPEDLKFEDNVPSHKLAEILSYCLRCRKCEPDRLETAFRVDAKDVSLVPAM